ncbi:MAG: hypothetical protein EA427_01875 [Spirochaetaceae bacterium]|nr:MAG: hypothetical protein EA427_01875 [Spirochaetaceae bacterium]
MTLPAIAAVAFLLLVPAFPERLSAQESPGAVTTGMLVEIPLPLTIVAGSERTRPVLKARINDAMQLVSVEAAPVLAALTETVLPNILENLTRAAEDGWLTPEELGAQGFTLDFDRHQLSAQLRVPLTALGTQTLHLYQPRRLPGFAVARNADIALGVPAWTQYRASHRSEGNSISAVSMRASPGLHLYSWVLESDLQVEWAHLEEERDPDLSAENTRLVRFWEDSGHRLQAGQFVQFTRGLQVPTQLLGVSFDNLEADTGRRFYPSLLDRPLMVDEAGTIDVYLNERRIRSFPVQPGQYELQDLPLPSGINRARVEYTRAGGGVEEYELIIPHAGGILKQGAFSYALALGVREEDLEVPAGSGFLRYGLAETLTAGVLLEGSSQGGQAGAELVAATPIGEPLVAGYGSLDDELTPGWAAQAGYRLVLPGRPRLPLFATTVEYRSSTNMAARQAWQVSSSLSQTLPGEVGLSLGHLYRTFHDDSRITSTLFATLSRNLGPRLGLRVTGTVDTTDPEEQWGVRITVSSRAARRNLSGTATIDAREATMDLSGAATRPGPVTLSAGARASTISLDEGTLGGVSGTARAAGARFDASGSAGITLTEGDSLADQEIRGGNYAIQFGSGLYMADGALALGAPTRSSFALVRPDRDLPTRTVIVRRGGASLPRESGSLGPAFLPNLSPGAQLPITVDVPELPADYSLGRTQFILAPGYRSGTTITIVSLQRLYVRARILDENGRGLAYKGMVVSPLFEIPEELEDQPPGGPSFTDDDGTFEVYGLVPGEYSLVLRDGTERRAVFTVPADPGPLVILDDIRLQGGSR